MPEVRPEELTPAGRAKAQWDSDFEELMKRPEFRRFLMALRTAYVDGPVFDVDRPQLDAMRAALREGERRIVMRLWKQATDNFPKLVQRMLNEGANDYADFQHGNPPDTKE